VRQVFNVGSSEGGGRKLILPYLSAVKRDEVKGK